MVPLKRSSVFFVDPAGVGGIDCDGLGSVVVLVVVGSSVVVVVVRGVRLRVGRVLGLRVGVRGRGRGRVVVGGQQVDATTTAAADEEESEDPTDDPGPDRDATLLRGLPLAVAGTLRSSRTRLAVGRSAGAALRLAGLTRVAGLALTEARLALAVGGARLAGRRRGWGRHGSPCVVRGAGRLHAGVPPGKIWR